MTGITLVQLTITKSSNDQVVEYSHRPSLTCDCPQARGHQARHEDDRRADRGHDQGWAPIVYCILCLCSFKTEQSHIFPLQIADKDGDGDVNYLEFMRLMKK